ncbi:tetraspanin-18-like [Symsagittifera roscoffensis]|uniref:tetraspanin-18-like n=1 Tax=Symsagittifera roscoffensis TaxID=84072 RepID=UPI00307B935B
MGTKVDPTSLSGKHLRLSRTIIIIFTIIVMLMTLGIIGLICVLLFAYNIDELSEIINSQTTSNLGIFVLSTFGVLLVTSCLGLCGALRQSGCTLKLFAFFLTILTVIEFAVASYYLAYSSEVESFLSSQMDSSMEHYKGENSTGADSIAWNFLQLKFDCCGIEREQDWAGTAWERMNNTVDGHNQKYPYTCCKISPEPGIEKIRDGLVRPTSADLDKCYIGSPPPGLHTEGCYDTLNQLMSEFGVWISVAIFVTIAIQLLLVYLSCQISTKHQAGNSFMFSSRVKDEKE